MNIQIFGTNKCNDTKKAVRYFKERKIKYQFIDMKQKGMSRGELAGVIRAVGGFENLLDENCKDKQALALVRYISDSSREETLRKETWQTGQVLFRRLPIFSII